MTKPKPSYTWLTSLGDVVEGVENDQYLTVLMDYGDCYEVLTYNSTLSHETGWELCNNTGTDIYTLEDAKHDYKLHLDLYYGLEMED
jgi:hypothetical protein